jgi:hypothetical protein
MFLQHQAFLVDVFARFMAEVANGIEMLAVFAYLSAPETGEKYSISFESIAADASAGHARDHYQFGSDSVYALRPLLR